MAKQENIDKLNAIVDAQSRKTRESDFAPLDTSKMRPDDLGKLSKDKKKVIFPNGTEYNAVISGDPSAIDSVTRVTEDTAVVAGDQINPGYYQVLSNAFIILYRYTDQTYWMSKLADAANESSYYALDVDTIADGPYDVSAVRFSQNGKHIFCASAVSAGADQFFGNCNYGWALNWSLVTDDMDNKVVQWTDLTQKSITLDTSTLPIPSSPALPGPAPSSPAIPISGTPAVNFNLTNSSSASDGTAVYGFVVYDTSTGPKTDIVGNWESTASTTAEYQPTPWPSTPAPKYTVTNTNTNDYLFEVIDGGAPTSTSTLVSTFGRTPKASVPPGFTWYGGGAFVFLGYDIFGSQTGTFYIFDYSGRQPGFKYQNTDLTYVSATVKQDNQFVDPPVGPDWIVESGGYLSLSGIYDIPYNDYPYTYTNSLLFLRKQYAFGPTPPETDHEVPDAWKVESEFLEIKPTAPEAFQTIDMLTNPSAAKVQKWTWNDDLNVPVAGKFASGSLWDSDTYELVDFVHL